MKKVAIVFWSGTGNTEEMASLVAEGVKEKGGEAQLMEAAEFSSEKMKEFDAIAFGCPSMGAEQLEETEFEPMFSDCEGSLLDKAIGLFGSYGWGDGEWMRDWEDRCKTAGATLSTDPVICQDAPDDDAQEDCRALGRDLAA